MPKLVLPDPDDAHCFSRARAAFGLRGCRQQLLAVKTKLIQTVLAPCICLSLCVLGGLLPGTVRGARLPTCKACWARKTFIWAPKSLKTWQWHGA